MDEIARVLHAGDSQIQPRMVTDHEYNVIRHLYREHPTTGYSKSEICFDASNGKLLFARTMLTRERHTEWVFPTRCDPMDVLEQGQRIAILGGHEGLFSWYSEWTEGGNGNNLFVFVAPTIQGIPIDLYQALPIEAEYESGKIVSVSIGSVPRVSSNLLPTVSASQAELTALQAFENTLPPRVISWRNRGQLVHYLPRRPDYPYPGIPDLSHLREANQTVLAYLFRYEDYGYSERDGHRMTPMAIVDAHSGRLLNIFKPGYGALGGGTVKKGSSLAKLDISHETVSIELAGKKIGTALGSVTPVGNAGKFKATKKVTICFAKLSIPVEWDSKSGLVRMRTANGYAYGKPSKSVAELIRKS